MTLYLFLWTVMTISCCIWPCRIISMTFNTFGRSITIKSDKLSKLLIAEKNTWGIATDSQKRNKMSLWGVIGYVMFLPQLVLIPYSWWFCIKTETRQWPEIAEGLLWISVLYYLIALMKNISEANRFRKGKVW